MNRFHSVSHVLIRASLALFTCVVLVLFQSAFWSNDVSPMMQAVLSMTALLAYFRPHHGLLLLAAMTPLGRLISHLLDSQIRCAEALVLAFLTGALLRGWTLHRFRVFPSSHLHIAALVLGFVVVASCIEQLWLLQLQRNFPGPFALDLLGYSVRHYLTSFRGFGTIYYAMLWLEGMALLLYGMHYCATRDEFSSTLLRMVVFVTVGIAILNFAFFANELIDTGEPRARFVEFLTRGRFSAHVGDVNAAGSFFVMVLFIAAGMAIVEQRAVWIFASLSILLAVWLTSSRAAIFSVLMISMAAAAASTIARLRKPLVSTLLMLPILLTVGVFVWRLLPQHFFDSTATKAVNIRWMFLTTTARMLDAYPLSGLGIGQFSTWSGRFSSPELVAIYPSENAHNNFAQVAGELGISGLIAFVFILYISLHRWPRHDREKSRHATPVRIGVAAFLVTCLAGHPLLIPEVGYDFWLTLALVPGVLLVHERLRSTSIGVAALCGAILFISVVPRIYFKMPLLNWASVTYGVDEDGFISSRARLFVPAATAHGVTVPLRAGAASPETPVEIDVIVDDKLLETVAITDRRWQMTEVPLASDKSIEFHEIDLRIRPSYAAASPRGVELGERSIILKPNG